MRLAEFTVLQIEVPSRSSSIALRPSLRAAALLERRHGFQKLFAGCCDGNLTLMAEIVDACSGQDFLNTIIDIPLAKVMPTLLETLPAFVLTLAGADPDNKSDSQTGEASIPFEDYHAKLFRIGTGWLGWSPDTTWNATATEITEAYKGHVEMLRAIHGGGENDNARPTDRPEHATLDRGGLANLKAMGGLTCQ